MKGMCLAMAKLDFNDKGYAIYNDDALEILKLLPDKSVDLVVSDPPYIMDKAGRCFGDKGEGSPRPFLQALNDNEEGLRSGFDFAVLDELRRIQKVENLYLFCNAKLLRELMCYYRKDNIDVLVWWKENPVPTFKYKYLSDVEYILFVCNDRTKLKLTYDTASKVFHSGIFQNKESTHPTEKPITICDKLIENSSKKGEVVLDMFMGSGTTIKSAIALKRKAIGIEINPEYYAMAKERLCGIEMSLFA